MATGEQGQGESGELNEADAPGGGGLVAIVLAAGSSRRMGGAHKLGLPWRGVSVLRRTLGEILAAGLDEVVLVLGPETARFRAEVENLGVRVVMNERAAVGMHSSIRLGIEAAGERAGYLVCLADQPLITAEEYRAVLAGFSPGCLAAPAYGGRRGNPVLVAGAFRAEILAHEDDDRGCAYLFAAHPERVRLVEMSADHVLRDVDTVEDYEAALGDSGRG